MSQITLFNTPNIPESFEDIDRLLENVREGETDEDLFSYNNIVNGRSYSFYGTKVFEFILKKSSKGNNKIKVCSEVASALGQIKEGEKNSSAFHAVTLITQDDVTNLINALKVHKRFLFRNIIVETFACCNDFKLCSDAEHCIHQSDRFYNGCTYRTNLEQGKIFYGPKRNID